PFTVTMPSLMRPCISLLDEFGTTVLKKRSSRSPSLFLSTVISFIITTPSCEEKLDQHQYDTNRQCTVGHVENREIIAENQNVHKIHDLLEKDSVNKVPDRTCEQHRNRQLHQKIIIRLFFINVQKQRDDDRRYDVEEKHLPLEHAPGSAGVAVGCQLQKLTEQRDGLADFHVLHNKEFCDLVDD